MSTESPVVDRVEKAIGPAAATMFAEEGADRHLIGSLTMTAVALYLLGKYLDGFIVGLGISELGKKHGQKVAEAVTYAASVIKGQVETKPEQMAIHAEVLSQAVLALEDHRSNPQALESASSEVRVLMDEQGIPESEAERISVSIEEAVWRS